MRITQQDGEFKSEEVEVDRLPRLRLTSHDSGKSYTSTFINPHEEKKARKRSRGKGKAPRRSEDNSDESNGGDGRQKTSENGKSRSLYAESMQI